MNKNFKIKSILASSILICFVVLSFANTTSYAQESDNEATNSASIESIKNIKEILKKNISSGAVQGALDNLLNKKTATIGEVTRITDETITINNRSGIQIIPIGDTHSITKDDKTIEVSDIAVENWVTVLGKIKDDNFSPVFIYVHTESLQPKTQVIDIGTITEITSKTITITPRSGESDKTVTILSSTDFEDLDGTEISLNDLEEDITILISGHKENNKISALTIKSLAPLADSPESN